MPTASLNDLAVTTKTANVSDLASDEELDPVAASLKDAQQTDSWASKAASVIGQSAAATVPVVKAGAEELATNPNVPRIAAQIGRSAGGIAPVVGGLVEGGPIGGLVGMAAAAKGAWAGGKTGWFTGKLAQQLAAPIAKAANAIEPYAGPLSALSAEGATLGNINSPQGVSAFANSLTPAAGKQFDSMVTPDEGQALHALIAKGASALDAAKTISMGNLNKFTALMKLYLAPITSQVQ